MFTGLGLNLSLSYIVLGALESSVLFVTRVVGFLGFRVCRLL